MLLNEIRSDIIYRNKLNPKLWKDNYHLHSDVRKQLERIAIKFIEFLGLSPKFVKDVIITGSNCNYNWRENSDLDCHVVVDSDAIDKDLNGKINVTDYLKTKKELWNHEHKIKILGIPVELYAQDMNEARSADDVTFSLLHNHWIKAPIRRNRNEVKDIDEKEVNKIYRELRDNIKDVLKNGKSKKDVMRIKNKLRKLRTKGLLSQGEFGVINVAFKKLRNRGYVDKLDNLSKEMNGKDLSLHEK
jgi:hypothetical protein